MTTSLICASHSPLLYCYAKAPDRWDELQAAYRERELAAQAFDADLVMVISVASKVI
jgi:hypothetical protein